MQELAWRDYWQQVWLAKGDSIHNDLKNEQSPVSNFEIPEAVVSAKTGIELIDRAINTLHQQGYMHNHMRMYIASICCNVAKSHWREPSRWMYYYLLDGDLASNQLSWQWVAGSFSNKKYVANQENINHFFHGTQRDTFLDIPYEHFDGLEIPEILTHTTGLKVSSALPTRNTMSFKNQKTLIYNYYNLDPEWHTEGEFQRIFLLEPSVFSRYPVGTNCIEFAQNLSKNIPDIKIFVGEFNDLLEQIDEEHIVYKEHPLNAQYKGLEEPRDWISSVNGYFPSFFSFWKKVKRELQQ